MRKFFMTVIAAVAMLLGGLAAAAPASAVAIPSDLNGHKFWSSYICVDGSAINGDYYRVAYIAQQWNIRSGYNLHLDYEDDCAVAGYPPSRRMVVGTYNNVNDANCLVVTNAQTEGYGGFARWTNGPGIYINTAFSTCVGGQGARDKIVSQSIGYLLGLKILNSEAYNSRVMNNTEWSRTYVTLPDTNSGSRLANLYTNVYCQPEGTVC